MWEEVFNDNGIEINRLKVPGGWLVTTIAMQQKDHNSMKVSAQTIFYSNPEHDWALEEDKPTLPTENVTTPN